ncbi:MAG TPA: fumarylacetoacetate hydrolase family protein [Ensifer sp.]|nr:fumarylacetoacetate hydrolase family protein [Ensifer sp.]
MNTKFGFVRVGEPKGHSSVGIVVQDRCLRFSDVATLSRWSNMENVIESWDQVVAAAMPVANQLADGSFDDRAIAVSEARLLAPIDPPQIFCTGANYRTHVAEIIVDRFSEEELAAGASREALFEKALAMMDERARTGMPYIFTRILSTCAGPFDDLRLPTYTRQPDWEAELAVVFKSGGLDITRADAMNHVAGYMVVNDVTNRDLIFTADPKSLGSDWLHAKNNPGYFPMGPMIVPKEFVQDPHNLAITLKLNGKVMQDARTSDMIFDIPRQIEVLSTYARIMPGDVLATGSPAGNGTHYDRYLQPGDVMEVSVEGLGGQRTRCVAAA